MTTVPTLTRLQAHRLVTFFREVGETTEMSATAQEREPSLRTVPLRTWQMRIGSQVFTLAQLDDEGMALEAYSFGTSHARFWITYFDRGVNNPQVTMPRRCDDLEDDLLLLQIATPLWIWDKNEMIPFGFYER